MIVQMKKITVLISARERDKALLRLRDLGVVHIESVKNPSSEELSSIESRLGQAEKALHLIGNPPAGGDSAGTADASRTVSEIIELSRKKEFLQRELAEYQKHNRWFEEWGTVSLESLEILRASGLDTRFYIAPQKALKDLPKDQNIEVVGQKENRVYLVHITEKDSPRLDFPEDPMPAVEIGPMRLRMSEINASEEAIDRIVESTGSPRRCHPCRAKAPDDSAGVRPGKIRDGGSGIHRLSAGILSH